MGSLPRLEGRTGGVLLGGVVLVALLGIGREVAKLLGEASANAVVEVPGASGSEGEGRGGAAESGASSTIPPALSLGDLRGSLAPEPAPFGERGTPPSPMGERGAVAIDAPPEGGVEGEGARSAKGPELSEGPLAVKDESLGLQSAVVFRLPEWTGVVSARVAFVLGDAESFASWRFDPDGVLGVDRAYTLGEVEAEGGSEARLVAGVMKVEGHAALVVKGEGIATYTRRIPKLEASSALDLGELPVGGPAALRVRFLRDGRPQRLHGGLIVQEIAGLGDRFPCVGVADLHYDDEAELESLRPGSNRLLLVGHRGEVLAHQLIHLDPLELGPNLVDLEVLPTGDRSALWVEGISSLGVPVRIRSEHLLLLGDELPTSGRAPDEFAHRALHTFSGLESGAYRLIVDDPAFEPEEFTSLRPGKRLQFLNLVGSSALRLRVHDLESGEPIRRFRARLHSLDPELRFECDLPRAEDFDETGLVPELTEGDWAVEVEAPGYVASYERVEMLLSREVRNVAVGMGRGGTLAGRVLDASKVLGVPGIRVDCVAPGGETSKMQSGDHGEFRFELLEAGSWELRAGLEGSKPTVETFVIQGHGAIEDIELALPEAPMIRGALGVPEGGRVDGMRLAAIAVDLEYPGRLRSAEGALGQRREAHRMESAIDGAGRFEIGPLHSGPHALFLHVPSPLVAHDLDPRGGGPGIDWPLLDPKTVEVHWKNGANTKVRLGAEAPGSLRVEIPRAPRVESADPRSWVLEVVDARGEPWVAMEVREGTAELTLPAGTWDLGLRQRSDGWRVRGSEPVTVEAGEVTEIGWDFSTKVSKARVVDAKRGAPLPETAVRWWSANGAGGRTTSDGLGWIDLELPIGTYGIARDDPSAGEDPRGVEFSVTETGVAERDLSLP